MAEIVRGNFHSMLPYVEECIQRSEFVAIDTEFTGLYAKPEDEGSLFDSLDVRYQKLRRFAKTFMICQFGLSAFVKDPAANRYVAHTFNFYVLPRDSESSHTLLTFQASNAEFLCNHKFDFNKLFYDGIPYLNQKQERELLRSEGEAFRDIGLQEALGFTLVFRALLRSKPILGHNMLSDLCLMYQSFYEPLPERYEEFKRRLHELFPVIIDTKRVCYALQRQLSASRLLEFTGLEDLYDSLASHKGSFYMLCNPDVCHADESQIYASERKFHEAGFDAYCVGFVFLRAAHMVAMKGLKSSESHPVHIKQYFRVMEAYTNQVNVIRGPVSYIMLGGEDPQSRRSDWLVVSSKNKDSPITMEMLQEQFKGAGSMDVQIISPSSSLVVFASKIRAEQVVLDCRDHPHLTVRRYSRIGILTRRFLSYSGTVTSSPGFLLLPEMNAQKALFLHSFPVVGGSLATSWRLLLSGSAVGAVALLGLAYSRARGYI